MATVGSLGGIVFNTSSRRILTFDNYSRKGTVKMATHEVIGQKSNLEYTGLEPEEITFEIKLPAQFHSRPEAVIEKLRRMKDEGQVVSFILGSKPVSQNKWVITDIGESVIHWGPKGKILYATVNITLKEYVITGLVGSTAPWGTEMGQIKEYKDTIEQYKEDALDFMDKVDDVMADVGGIL